MEDHELLERISINPDVMAGKPVIKGTRLTVGFILGLLARGASFEEILGEYGGVGEDDIRASILFASEAFEAVAARGNVAEEDVARLSLAAVARDWESEEDSIYDELR